MGLYKGQNIIIGSYMLPEQTIIDRSAYPGKGGVKKRKEKDEKGV
jgi:hypothetical protein